MFSSSTQLRARQSFSNLILKPTSAKFLGYDLNSGCKIKLEDQTGRNDVIQLSRYNIKYPGNLKYAAQDQLLKAAEWGLADKAEEALRPYGVKKFLSLTTDNINELSDKEWGFINQGFQPPKPNERVQLFSGFRQLTTAQKFVRRGVGPMFVTECRHQAVRFTSKKGVLLEFCATSNRNQSANNPYCESKYTDFESIKRDGVRVIAVYPGVGEATASAIANGGFD